MIRALFSGFFCFYFFVSPAWADNPSYSAYETGRGTLIEKFESASDWSVSAGTGIIANNTARFISDTQSVTFTVENGNTASFDKTVALDLSSVSNIAVWFYVDNANNEQTNAQLVFCSEADCSKYYYVNLGTTASIITGWNKMVFNKNTSNDFASVGGPNWASIDVIRINLDADPATSVSFSFDDMRTDPDGMCTMIWTFDDGRVDQYTNAFPIMRANNMPGVVAVITGHMGETYIGYNLMTTANAQEMYAAGWDVVSHTVDHVSLAGGGVTPEQRATQLQDSMAWLNSNGFTRSSMFLIYPGGSYNSTVIADAITAGYKMARTVGSGGNKLGHLAIPGNSEEFDLSPYAVGQVSAATLTGAVDKCIAKKNVLIFYAHSIVDEPADGTEYDKQDFQTVIEYIKTKVDAGTAQVRTWSEYYNSFLLRGSDQCSANGVSSITGASVF